MRSHCDAPPLLQRHRRSSGFHWVLALDGIPASPDAHCASSDQEILTQVDRTSVHELHLPSDYSGRLCWFAGTDRDRLPRLHSVPHQLLLMASYYPAERTVELLSQ